jgi:hypothetical protein
MKRCEREWDAATAAGVQRLVKELCGRCLCETGDQCPLFSYAPRQVAVVGDADQSAA